MKSKPIQRLGSSDALATYAIGLKLRTLRTTRDLTLTRLAALTGYSTALLSKLETDRMVPTLQTLEKICRAFGIDLGHFFCQPQTFTLSITRKAHTHAFSREPHTPRSTPLHFPAADHAQLAQILELPFGNSFTFGECGTITELTAHVLEGTLAFRTPGSSETAEAGDSFVYRADQPLLWSAAEKPHCRLLVVSARPSPGQPAA